MTINRREFLGRCAAGGASLATPMFLHGCAAQPEAVVDVARPDNLFSSWFGLDQPAVSQIMSRLTGSGADYADAFFQLASETHIAFENGVISQHDSNKRQGAALRVVNGEHAGFTTTRDLGLPALLKSAESAAGTLASGVDSPFPLEIASTRNLYPVSVPWSSVSLGDKTALLEYLDQRVRAQEATTESVTIRWDDVEEHVMIATADGALVSDARPLTRLTLVVTAAKDGTRQSGFAVVAVRHGVELYSEARLNELAAEALARTMIQFEARRAPSGDLPVILASGTGGVLLHEVIGHHFEADFVRSGSSAYAARLGETIADSAVTLVEDTTLPREPGALNVDDEGSGTGRTVLVENGVLTSFVHDRDTARHFGVATTGSGRRESFEHLPMPRLTSTFLESGPHARDEIVAAVEYGVICETFSAGRAEIESGKFVFDVKNGWLVEKGRIAGPTKDFRIEGSGAELLGNITMLGNDSRMDPAGWICGKRGQNLPVSHGAPTTLISSLAVSPI
jgi:TldD protein